MYNPPNNFWQKLPKPFFAMAPMADVTDCVFRELISKYSRHGEVGGGPDVFWTEFVSTDGLALGGRDALLVDLKFNPEIERPIVAQLFGSNIETMENPETSELTNISERAIDRTFHKV